MSWIDNGLGIYPKALMFRSERSAVLAANIANSDTDNFKARDYDFKEALKGAADRQTLTMTGNNSNHLGSSAKEDWGSLQYRVPTKLTANGNTVESEVEQAAFSENAVRYQTTLQFLNGTISGIRMAIRGE